MYAEQQGIVSFENDLKRVQVYNTIASSDDACFFILIFIVKKVIIPRYNQNTQ